MTKNQCYFLVHFHVKWLESLSRLIIHIWRVDINYEWDVNHDQPRVDQKKYKIRLYPPPLINNHTLNSTLNGTWKDINNSEKFYKLISLRMKIIFFFSGDDLKTKHISYLRFINGIKHHDIHTLRCKLF